MKGFVLGSLHTGNKHLSSEPFFAADATLIIAASKQTQASQKGKIWAQKGKIWAAW